MVVISIIPATQKVEIRRIAVQGQPKQNISELISELEAIVHICIPSYQRGRGRRIAI
jgi:uncharacterized protein (DUF934 family)